MKVFIASFHRASEGAYSFLKEKLKRNEILSENYQEVDSFVHFCKIIPVLSLETITFN